MLVGLGHVGGHCTLAAFVGRASVAGDAFPLGEEFHHQGTEADIELLAHQGVRDREVVTFALHRVSNVDPREFPLGILIGLGWQRPKRRAIEGVKQLVA